MLPSNTVTMAQPPFPYSKSFYTFVCGSISLNKIVEPQPKSDMPNGLSEAFAVGLSSFV